jgi:hypothetical protein
MRDRHLAYYGALAEQAEPEVFRSGRDDPALRRLADEVSNLRAALDWVAGTDAEEGLRIAAALNLFWLFTGRYGEGDAACARALDAAGQVSTPLRALVLAGRATLGIFRGAFLDTPGWAQEALRSARRAATLGCRPGRTTSSVASWESSSLPAGGRSSSAAWSWRGRAATTSYELSLQEGEKARVVIRAPYSRWKQIISQDLDPSRA